MREPPSPPHQVLRTALHPVEAIAPVPVPDGRLLIALGTGRPAVPLWELASGRPVGEPLAGQSSAVWAVLGVPMPDGRVLLATGSRDETIRLWDPSTGDQIGPSLSDGTGPVLSLAPQVLPDGRIVVAATSGSWVRIWDVVAGTAVGAP